MLYTDIYNAEKFYAMYKDKIRWSRDFGGWFIYNGKHWERDSNGTIKKYAIELHKKLHEELQSFDGDDAQLELFSRHVKSSGSNSKLEAMLDCSKAYLGLAQENFDNQDFLFNCDNGTLNLGTKKFQDHSLDDYLTKISGVEFDDQSECPMWLDFLNDIFMGKQEIIDFIQRAIGYSLTASTEEHCLFILYGCGRNGKSIFVNTISQMMGHYSMNCPSSTFIKKPNGAIPNDVAGLKGARFVTAVESNQNVTLDEALIKQMTGGDKITARFLHKEYFEFTPTFKIWIATNHKPNIRGTDVGIWRRIRMIPFDLQITEAKEDRNLGNKLLTELPGIFLWAAKGYVKWKNGGLKTPKSIIEATVEYKDEEDDIGQFIKDFCVRETESFIPVTEFKQRFKDVNGYYKSQKNISEYMIRAGFASGRPTMNMIQVRSWMGLRFTKPLERERYGDSSW